MCGLIGVFSPQAQALTVGPTRILNNLEAGEGTRGYIRVHNAQEVALEVVVELADWRLCEEDGVEFKEAGSLARSSAHWIHLSPTKFVLAPGEYKKVAYSITFPREAQGGYYAAILVTGAQKAPPPTVEGEHVIMIISRARIGVLVYNEVAGTKKEVELLDFSVSAPDNGQLLTITYEIKNRGQGFIRSEGTFHLINAEGRLYASGLLSTVRVHPGYSARGWGEWVGSLPEGEYDLIMTLRLGPFEEKIIVREKRIKVGEVD